MKPHMHRRPRAPVWGSLRTGLSRSGVRTRRHHEVPDPLPPPLPSPEILDPLGHSSQLAEGISHSLLPPWHPMRENSGFHSFLFPSFLCSVLSTSVNDGHSGGSGPSMLILFPDLPAFCIVAFHMCERKHSEESLRRLSFHSESHNFT